MGPWLEGFPIPSSNPGLLGVWDLVTQYFVQRYVLAEGCKTHYKSHRQSHPDLSGITGRPYQIWSNSVEQLLDVSDRATAECPHQANTRRPSPSSRTREANFFRTSRSILFRPLTWLPHDHRRDYAYHPERLVPELASPSPNFREINWHHE